MMMKKLDQQRVLSFLREIESNLIQGVLPVHNGHLENLSEAEETLECLLLLKKEGLISGDLVTKGIGGTPYRMTNIRLTYLGIRLLRT